MAEGSPDKLTALELQEFGNSFKHAHVVGSNYMFILWQEVEAEAPPEDDDMDHGRSSEQDSFRGCIECPSCCNSVGPQAPGRHEIFVEQSSSAGLDRRC